MTRTLILKKEQSKPLISRRVKVASRKHLHEGWVVFGVGVNRQGGREESLYWKKARRAQHSQRVKRLNFLWVAASPLERRNFNFAPPPPPPPPGSPLVAVRFIPSNPFSLALTPKNFETSGFDILTDNL